MVNTYKAFDRELLKPKSWSEQVLEHLGSLTPTDRDAVDRLLPKGAASIREPAKNQRQRLGIIRPAGELLTWHSSGDPGQRHLLAVLRCHHCWNVTEMRIDHYLGHRDGRGIYETCGCGAVKNREGLLAKHLARLTSDQRVAIAEQLEMKASRNDLIRNHKIDSLWAPYLLNRVWRVWAEDLWRRTGDEEMVRVWKYVCRTSLESAVQTFPLNPAEIRAIGRWCQREARAEEAARQAAESATLAVWNSKTEKERNELLAQLDSLSWYARRAVDLVEDARAEAARSGWVEGRYIGEFTRKEFASSSSTWSAFRSVYEVLEKVPDSVLAALSKHRKEFTVFKEFMSIAGRTLRRRARRRKLENARRKLETEGKTKRRAVVCSTDGRLRYEFTAKFDPELSKTLILAASPGGELILQ